MRRVRAGQPRTCPRYDQVAEINMSEMNLLWYCDRCFFLLRSGGFSATFFHPKESCGACVVFCNINYKYIVLYVMVN